VVAPVRVPAVHAAAPPRPSTAGEAVADETKVCRSPIAGTVIRVLARPGLAVQPGDVLLVLEAMKMETNITAPVAATVAALKAAPGEAVRSGQVVVEFG
jgi:biotin carboxyl carrier protein